MSAVAEAGKWLLRVVSILPEFVRLWDAAKSSDPHEELEAQLALTRKIKDRQAREEIGAE